MRNVRVLTALALPVTLALGACGEAPTAPELGPSVDASFSHGGPHGGRPGSGLEIDIVGIAGVPLVGGGTVTLDEAVVHNFALVESTAGVIAGLEITGTLTGTAVNVLGETVTLDATPFTALVDVTSSGPGKCSAVNLDLTALDIQALGVVDATVPATVDVASSGAAGVLLCNLGRLLGGLTGVLTGGAARGLVNAINNQL